MSTLYAVKGGDLKIIVRAATPDAAGDVFWREATRRGAPVVHSWIVEASSITAEQVAECEHVVEVDEARELAARFEQPLPDIERDRLRAWARSTIGGLYGRTVLRKTQSLAALLGIEDDDADALRKDAKWP